MDAFERNLQPTPAGPGLKRFDYCRRFQDAARRLDTKEHLPVDTIARDLLQIVLNRGADLIGQWKLQRVASLALANSNGCGYFGTTAQTTGYRRR
jgi:hypothetical protein